jgi:hypothetical protein
MNNDEVNKTIEAINELNKRFESLIDESQKRINNLPPEERKKIEFINNEMNAIKEGIRKGDFSAFEQILKRYAG